MDTKEVFAGESCLSRYLLKPHQKEKMSDIMRNLAHQHVVGFTAF